MANTTAIRASRKIKERLEHMSKFSGLNNLSKTLDFAVDSGEDKLDEYHGSIDSLLKFKALESGFKSTSETLDKVLAKVDRR